MKNWIFLLLFCPVLSHAVVKRHDIQPERYVLEKSPEYLIDMPHEGHGVLIGPQWIVTVAHTIFYDYVGKNIQVGTNTFEIEHVYKHPEYVELDKSLLKGDAAPLMKFLKARSDIALIKLSSPVSDIKPIDIYRQNAELGKEVTVYGRGATGDGKAGEKSETKSLRQLNHFNNVIDEVSNNWLAFTFNEPANALPLEGMHGSGDSGGASVIVENGTPYLVGLSSWQHWQGDLAKYKGGLYGTTAYQVRLSSYKRWIQGILDGQ